MVCDLIRIAPMIIDDLRTVHTLMLLVNTWPDYRRSYDWKLEIAYFILCIGNELYVGSGKTVATRVYTARYVDKISC